MSMVPSVNIHDVKMVEIKKAEILNSCYSTHIAIVSEDNEEFELVIFHQDRRLAIFSEDMVLLPKPQAE